MGTHGGSSVARVGAIAAAAALAGCAGPLSTLDPAGPAADRVATLWWIMLAGATLILVGVCLLAVIPFLQARRGAAVSSRAPADGVWLWGGGLAFPLVTLLALLAWAFAIDPIDDAARTGEAPVRVEALARQWHWSFTHPDAPGGPLTLDGRLHVPAGRQVEVAITSADVIHSFWVPRLAGKRDAIPGRVNTITILAEEPGVYGAVCAEYCGLGHAGMTFEVVAHEQTAYADALARLAEQHAREARR
ncbi:cytochrome c oxidase subunit II [Salinarimonas rosea]|uniref:cytochrome c oxidase subunit II n=1 Tax=Salinarimonas rosea TaxID=552063 RepID=UPI0006945789|nr:cytochrome c oxidase subunit II [Salinarimonas rosea]